MIFFYDIIKLGDNMKKLLILVASLALLTGCSIEQIKEDINSAREQGDCKGTRENGQCCTVEYSGHTPDASGNCPGVQVPGDRLNPPKDAKSCYHVVCEDMNK